METIDKDVQKSIRETSINKAIQLRQLNPQGNEITAEILIEDAKKIEKYITGSD
jgi:hypothetical protein